MAVATIVRDNPDQSRYEILVDDQLAGFTEYQPREGSLAFVHTESFPEFTGQGLARRLVTEALTDVRRRGLGVLPYCPFVRRLITRHPDEFLSLVPTDNRVDFDLPQS